MVLLLPGKLFSSWLFFVIFGFVNYYSRAYEKNPDGVPFACFAILPAGSGQVAITVPSLSEDEIREKVLEQLGLTEENIYDRFYKCRTLPWDETRAAIILPEISSFKDYNNHVLDAYVLVVNRADGKILHRYYQPAEWISDADGESKREIFDITFDFAPYRVCRSIRYFSISRFFPTGVNGTRENQEKRGPSAKQRLS